MSAVSAYSKLEAVERQLEAALFLILRGFDPAPVHTLIGAARGVLYGLSKHDPNLVLNKWDNSILSRIVGPEEKDIRCFQNHVSNFFKHADRDPTEVLEGFDLDGLNRMGIQLCIIALSVAKDPISKPLNVALYYFGLSDDAIVPLDALVKGPEAQFPEWNVLGQFDRDIWRDSLARLLEIQQLK